MFQKLFTAKQIKEIDNQTIIKQKIRSDELMERAATALYQHIIPRLDKEKINHIFCGKGNNGGDALVLARLLYLNDYKVKCHVVPFSPNASPDFKLNAEKLKHFNFILEKFNPANPPVISNEDTIIDGIFGTGLSRPVSGIAMEAIKYINRQTARVYSIDIPSGLYADKSNAPGDAIIQADLTFSFQFPKISFFFPENAVYVPDFEIIDIGLEQNIIDEMPTNYFLLTNQILNLLHQGSKFSYKNNFGHVLIVGGQKGMIGAPVLASKAALRIGAGLVTNFLPKTGYAISQTAIPEVMTLTGRKKNHLSEIYVPEKINAVAIGMGMGTKPVTQKAFIDFLQHYSKPVILDADAINILAQNPETLTLVPPNSILTPHPGEFKRLVGSWGNDSEKWHKQKTLAAQHQLIVILKGAYTTITDGNNFYINPIANNALATAGSGDVLSGIIAGLFARRLSPLMAALAGVYIHGKTAESYTRKYAAYSMTASDIINELKYL